MTPDDLLEYLVQSAKSHDTHIAELVDAIAKTSEQQKETDRQLKETDRQLAETDRRLNAMADAIDLNFARLTRAMEGLTGHVSNHEDRIQRLEGEAPQG